MNVQVNQNERLIRPSDPAIRYTGRIDNSNVKRVEWCRRQPKL